MSPQETAPAAILSDEQLQIVRDLEALQEKLQLSDRAFAREYLQFSETVWGRIKSHEYFAMVKDATLVIDKLTDDLKRCQRDIATKERIAEIGWIETPEYKAVIRALSEVRSKPISDPDRLIIVLGPTGGGKTVLSTRLAVHERARVVEARESWLRSYYSVCRDFSVAVGADLRDAYTPDLMEDRLIETLGKSRHTIVIDEGNFSARTLNLLKLLLNKTRVVVVLCAIPEAMRAWSARNAHEAAQIRRRTHCIVTMGTISADTAASFFHRVKLTDPERCGTIAARYSNAFGHFDFLTRLAKSFRDGSKVSPADIAGQAEDHRQLLGLKPLPPSP